jgi:uncharacterized membrane protein
MSKRMAMTITWSLLAFIVTVVVGYGMTGDLMKGGLIGVLCRVIKVPLYYGHDMLYAKWQETTEAPHERPPITHTTPTTTFTLTPPTPVAHCNAG